MERVTVFTPTYNRGNVLYRVYESLYKQTYKDFIWIIVDDGSEDKTKEIVHRFMDKANFKIEYYYQKNQGKHIATNCAVSKTQTELFVIADSDDGFVENALEVLVNTWDSIPNAEKKQYKGVICRCFDSVTKEPIGIFPKEEFDSNDLEGYFKYKLSFEKWMLFRTEVLREFPFPDENNGMKFFPETVVWQRMARKYKTRYIAMPLREYYRDQENALTNSKTHRFRENTYLWKHYVNDTFDYFWYKPLLFAKAFVGIDRDNIIIGKKFHEIMKIPNTWWKKLVCALVYPMSFIMSRKYKR